MATLGGGGAAEAAVNNRYAGMTLARSDDGSAAGPPSSWPAQAAWYLLPRVLPNHLRPGPWQGAGVMPGTVMQTALSRVPDRA